MSHETLHQSVRLGASPHEVFECLMDSERHSAFTGARSEIAREAGGSFSYFDGAIVGRLLEVEVDRYLVQELRAASWPEGHVARVTYRLESAEASQADIFVVENNIPAGHMEDVVAGWRSYWSGLAGYLRENKLAIVRRFVDEFKNKQNPDIVDELVVEDCRVHSPLPGLPPGREGLRVNGQLVCGAFPDVHVEREFFVVEGDIVVERAHARATHRGELVGIQPTQKPVTWSELHAYRLRDGLIAEVWSEADLLNVIVQVGALAPPKPDQPVGG